MEAGIEVVVTRLLPEQDEGESLAWLSAEERDRASRFVLNRDRRWFIMRRAGLRRLLGERLNVPPSSIGLTHRLHGKPVLSPPLNRSGFQFNVSHCEDLVLYALSSRGEIGIDVEALRVTEEADRIASSAFSAREHQRYTALRPNERPLAFLTWWTRKEAFVKATGQGLCQPLDTFDVSLASSESTCIVQDDHRKVQWHICSFFPAHGCIAALAHEALS
jgi:4'-phosphopantetheinyl transferase